MSIDLWRRRAGALLILALAAPGLATAADDPPKPAAEPAKVSYYKQVRPIFQAQCQGCHQPAKAGGGYVMTAVDRLRAGGESGDSAVVAGKPEESHLLEMIVPENGKAEMPRDRPPLSAAEIETVRDWIAQGAVDDTPAAALEKFDRDHPPVYSQ